jgi:hypothetical protein
MEGCKLLCFLKFIQEIVSLKHCDLLVLRLLAPRCKLSNLCQKVIFKSLPLK